MALAGFSGLLAALRHDRQSWTEEELFLLRLLLTSAFSGVFFALIPMPVFELLGREGPTLQITSLAYVVWLTVTVMRFRAVGRSVGKRTTRQPRAGILLFAASVLLGVTNIALGSIAVYEVMLLVVLGSPVVLFVSVFAALRTPPPR